MERLAKILFFVVILQLCTAPPVNQKKEEEAEANENEITDDKEGGLENYMEYHRYLKEVVDTLESDPQFREKIEKAEETDIRSGKIAHELEFVNHKVRTKLDELKRNELERLRHLANKQYEIENGLNFSHEKVGIVSNKEHLDHVNPHTFEIEDLKKLISKSTKDLAEADRARREEFKEYELQKEFEKQEKLKQMDEQHRKELEEQLKTQEEQHKKHKPLHHPGSKQQLEEVWEKQDHMDQQDFDPRTFFMMHDLDGNGVWDENEVKALFVKELDKMYSEGAPEDDMRERIEEMERMREHVFGEVDQNKDGLISYNEFIDQTKKQDFQEDKGWETLDEQRQFTEEEYRQFEKQRLEEVEKLVAQGMLPPHPAYHNPNGQQFPPQGYHPNQMHPGQVYDPNQIHHGQGYPQGQPQMHPGQPQMHPGQPQMHPGQGQMHPAQGQMHPAQGQMHPAQGQMHPAQGQMHPAQGQMHPAQGQMHPAQGQMHPAQGQMHPAQGQMHHAQGQMPPHAGQVHPAQGQMHPSQGQMPPHQGQMHPAQGQAQINAGQQAQGHPNQVPNAQLNPGQMAQAQVHPQQLPNQRPPVPQLDPQEKLQLNTNEILPNQPPAVQQKHQPPMPGQDPQKPVQSAQVQPQINQNQAAQPNVQQI